MKISIEKTKVINHFSNGWTAETDTAESGQGWRVSTMKGYNGKISSTAQRVTFTAHGISFSFGDKNIKLLSETGRATEKAIKEQHARALILFDEHEEIINENAKEVYKIEIGQRLFLDGYGKGETDGNAIIYEIKETNFGTSFLTVDTETLELSSSEYIKNISEKFGIGTYYREGDKFKGTQDELNNFVISANQLLAKENEREQSEKLLRQQAQAGKIEEGKEAVKIPSWAKTVIVAELYEDRSDSQSDYFSASGTKTVILGYSAHARNNMQELKKFALNFEETKAFSIGGDDLEHTTGHSVLPNYFLGSSSWSGWKIHKEKYYYDLENESGKNQVYIAFAEGRYFVNEGETVESVKNEPSNDQTAPKSGEVQIVDYSERSIAVIGDTKPIKDKLKELGGKFNFRLTCGAGWIFPKTKLPEIEKIFS